MPGILPMKVIKVGTSSQSRIAQACDRCRSKKIRCDGVRPTCSQCSTVGFECRTSDKLSRRAFPRGYTESLEERVRQLENEVRELKDLLDEKDEKIDLLSKIHGNRPALSPSLSTSPDPSATPRSTPRSSTDGKTDMQTPKDDTFRVHASPLLLGVENSDSHFMGASSGRSFIEALKRRIQETGKPCNDFNPEAFLHVQGCPPLSLEPGNTCQQAPPRLFTDRCVNVFFQEWAPLFPIVHKPTFLRTYEDFVANPDRIKDDHKLAQLYLVFSIAGLASDSPDMPQLAVCERQWSRTLETILMDNTMNTLQCLLLALLFCTMRADYKRLQHYKAIAVSLSHRLGLHQSQKRFSFGALTTETRKRVFWSLYTLDCFTAAILGLPKLLKEEDVQAEYPSDVDDEYVSEKGFQPTLPGEHTRLSSALSLFRASRILSRTLETNYPSTVTHDLSLQQMGALAADLTEWYETLPSHLKLSFSQDKPSTNVTGSRSPLLALVYYYIRTLIYRPAVGSSLGPKAAPALMSIADSSKHLIQIVQLLEERNMTFSFCLNKGDLLVICGMTLLYQVVDLKQDSKLMRDDERLVNDVIKILGRTGAAGTFAFKRIASGLIKLEEPPSDASGRQKQTDKSMAAPPRRPRTTVESPQRPVDTLGMRSRGMTSEANLLERVQKQNMRRYSVPHPPSALARSRHSIDGLQSNMQDNQQHLGPSRASLPVNHAAQFRRRMNFDYLSLSNTPSQSQPPSPGLNLMPIASSAPQIDVEKLTTKGLSEPKIAGISSSDWEMLLGTMDGGVKNVYGAIYGGSGFGNEASVPANAGTSEWSPDAWDLSNFNIGDFGAAPAKSAPPRSVLSVSDESLSSGEEVAPSELGLSVSDLEYHQRLLQGTGTSSGEEYKADGIDSFPFY